MERALRGARVNPDLKCKQLPASLRNILQVPIRTIQCAYDGGVIVCSEESSTNMTDIESS